MTLKRLSTPARMDEFERYSITVGFKAAHVSRMLTSGFFCQSGNQERLFMKKHASGFSMVLLVSQ
jgi:hypothetical protein